MTQFHTAMGTSSGRVDQPLWDKLLEAYTDDPGNHSSAARHANVQRRTARRAWDIGYPDRPWGIKPIRLIIKDLAELARSRLQLEADQLDLDQDKAELEAERDRERARQHALQSREQEGKLIQATRVATMNALAAAMKSAEGLGHAMTKLGGKLIEVSLNTESLTDKQMASLSGIMRRYSSTLRELSSAGQTAMQMERLYLGEPGEIIGVISELDTMPIADLVKMAGYQDEVLRRAQARGLVLLEGGLDKKATGE